MTGRVDTDPRISRRRRAIAKTRRRRIAGRAAGALGAGVVAWALFASPLLRVSAIRVVGGEHTSSREVARVAGLDASDNLLLVRPEAIATAAESLPWVRRAEVDRMLPGTIRVRITERRPAVVLAVGAARWTLDARGRVLTSGVAAPGLPTLSGAEVNEVEPGQRLVASEALGALAVYRALDPALRRRVAGIVAPSVERITLALDDGTLVRIGAPERLRAKRLVLDAVLARLRREARVVAYVDVRAPSRPAVAPRAADPVSPGASPSPAPSPSPTPSP